MSVYHLLISKNEKFFSLSLSLCPHAHTAALTYALNLVLSAALLIDFPCHFLWLLWLLQDFRVKFKILFNWISGDVIHSKSITDYWNFQCSSLHLPSNVSTALHILVTVILLRCKRNWIFNNHHEILRKSSVSDKWSINVRDEGPNGVFHRASAGRISSLQNSVIDCIPYQVDTLVSEFELNLKPGESDCESEYFKYLQVGELKNLA